MCGAGSAPDTKAFGRCLGLWVRKSLGAVSLGQECELGVLGDGCGQGPGRVSRARAQVRGPRWETATSQVREHSVMRRGKDREVVIRPGCGASSSDAAHEQREQEGWQPRWEERSRGGEGAHPPSAGPSSADRDCCRETRDRRLRAWGVPLANSGLQHGPAPQGPQG